MYYGVGGCPIWLRVINMFETDKREELIRYTGESCDHPSIRKLLRVLLPTHRVIHRTQGIPPLSVNKRHFGLYLAYYY